jgi:hypothetical protein
MRALIIRTITSGALLLVNRSLAWAEAPVKSFDDPPSNKVGTEGSAAASATGRATPSGETSPETSAETSGEAGDAVAHSERPADPSAVITERRQRAMAHYGAGNYDVALSELDKLTRDCSVGVGCSATLEASLYRDIGIVQAGGLDDEERAEASFARALRLDPMTTIEPRFATSDVMEAFEAAQEKFRDQISENSSSSHSSDEDAHGLVLLEGTSKYGVIQAVGPFGTTYTDSTLQLGGALTAAFTPAQSGFMAGARFRGGTYIGPDLGYIGGAVMVGGIFGRSLKKNRAGYVMGGMGFENLPNTGRTGLTFNASGGFLMGGLDVGGGLDINVGDPSNSQANHGNISVVFGIHIGLGKLF